LIIFWEPVVAPLLEALEPDVVVEVGSAKGVTTTFLVELASRRSFVVHAIDPAPSTEARVRPLVEGHEGHLVFHPQRSLEALPLIERIDAVLLDGDHNWYTVYHELQLLAELSTRDSSSYPLVFVHDVGWPYGRRDLYYEPDAIPPDYRHAYRTAGIVPGQRELADVGGFNPGLNHAVLAGGPRNGIRTAIEDFLADSGIELDVRYVIGFHGLAILVSPERVESNDSLRRCLDDLDSPAWLKAQSARLEQARLAAQARRRLPGDGRTE
jgi:hypothetical protein